MVTVNFDAKAAWAMSALNVAIGFVAVGTLIWFTDLVFCLVYHAVRGVVELVGRVVSRAGHSS